MKNIIKTLNVISPILRSYRYRNKKDPFNQFEEIKKKNNIFKNLKKNTDNVLIIPIRVQPNSNLFEGLLGASLGARGYNVFSLMCGQALNKCDNIPETKFFAPHCALCMHEQQRFTRAFEIDPIFFNEKISNKKRGSLLKLSMNAPIKSIFTYVHDGVPIGKHVEGSVSRSVLSSNIDLKKHEKIIRNYFFSSLMCVEVTRKTLRDLNPKFVIVSHGIYGTWGAALETCVADGYDVLVWGRGYYSGRILAHHDNSYIYDTITEGQSNWINDVVSDSNKKILDNYYLTKRDPKTKLDHTNYYSNVDQDNRDIFSKLGLDKSRSRIGIYPNIPWDGKMFSATKEFPDMNIFVKYFVEWAQENPNVDLIIRAHPAEAYNGNESVETFRDIVNEVCPVLPPNIIYINPMDSITSYEVSEICNAALMYSSTVALELSYASHPVIQVGLNHVSNKGIVFDAPTKEAMFEYLNKASLNQLKVSNEMKDIILKYANYWINRRHIPDELIQLDGLNFDGYNFTDLVQLKEGNFLELDWFIDRCTSKKPLIRS